MENIKLQDNVIVSDATSKRGGYVQVRSENGEIHFSTTNMIVLEGRQEILRCLFSGESLNLNMVFLGDGKSITTPDMTLDSITASSKIVKLALEDNVTEQKNTDSNVPTNSLDYKESYEKDSNGNLTTTKYITIDGVETNIKYNVSNFSKISVGSGEYEGKIVLLDGEETPIYDRETGTKMFNAITTTQPFIKLNFTIEGSNSAIANSLYKISEMGLVFKDNNTEGLFSRLIFEPLYISEDSTYYITYYIYF